MGAAKHLPVSKWLKSKEVFLNHLKTSNTLVGYFITHVVQRKHIFELFNTHSFWKIILSLVVVLINKLPYDISKRGIDQRKNNRKILFFVKNSFIIDKKTTTEKWSWRKLKNGIPVKTGKILCLDIWCIVTCLVCLNL